MLAREDIRHLYRRRAGWYDLSANAYYVIGFREWAYRRRAVRALGAQPGATILELGCGTGLNFELIERGIGPEGRLIGADMTDAMLVQARRRVEAHGWRNVSLIESDIARYEFPAGMAGVISTFALTLVAECDAVIARAAAALPAGGRLVVLDLKEPEWASQWLVTSAAWLTRPFGVTADLARRRPWEAMSRLLTDFRLDDLYFGFAYVASGTVGERRDSVPNGPRVAAIHTNTRSTLMKIALVALTLTLTAGAGFAGQQSRTFTGVVSDSMCVRDHAAMEVSPISKCVNDCVKASKDIHYSLLAGKNAYTLSDREKPVRFAGQKVKVTGVLREKTNVIDVESIEPVR